MSRSLYYILEIGDVLQAGDECHGWGTSWHEIGDMAVGAVVSRHMSIAYRRPATATYYLEEPTIQSKSNRKITIHDN